MFVYAWECSYMYLRSHEICSSESAFGFSRVEQEIYIGLRILPLLCLPLRGFHSSAHTEVLYPIAFEKGAPVWPTVSGVEVSKAFLPQLVQFGALQILSECKSLYPVNQAGWRSICA